MKTYYASKVLLKAGSELLKKEWGLKGADRSKDLLVGRDELIHGYERLIGKVGREKWAAIFGKVSEDSLTTEIAVQANTPFEGIRKGDLIFKVMEDEIAAVGVPAENTMLAESGGVALYVLTSGEFQVNVVNGNELYEVKWERGVHPCGGDITVYNMETGEVISNDNGAPDPPPAPEPAPIRGQA